MNVENLYLQLEEIHMKYKFSFMDIIYDINKTDKEKLKNLKVDYNSALSFYKENNYLLRYNLEIELLKMLFEETKCYSENNESNLFIIVKNDIAFIRRQIFSLDFREGLNNEYEKNFYEPFIEISRYDVLSKLICWYSYDSIDSIERLIFGSDNPNKTKIEIIKCLKKKKINLNDKIRRHEEFLMWFGAIKNRYLDEIKDIEFYIIELETLVPANSPTTNSEKKFNDEIFLSLPAQEWFFSTLDKLGVRDGKKPFNTIIGEIFHNSDCKSKIFFYSLKLKDYVFYLNNEFEKKMNDTRLHSRSKHEIEVKKLIKIYTESKSD